MVGAQCHLLSLLYRFDEKTIKQRDGSRHKRLHVLSRATIASAHLSMDTSLKNANTSAQTGRDLSRLTTYSPTLNEGCLRLNGFGSEEVLLQTMIPMLP